MIPLTPATQTRVRKLFHTSAWELVDNFLITECGDNLPMVRTDYTELAERIRFAVLKQSNGNLVRLRAATKEAAIDWRDTLMAAGFGEDGPLTSDG